MFGDKFSPGGASETAPPGAGAATEGGGGPSTGGGAGIVERSITALLRAKSELEAAGWGCELSVEAVEIYNEGLRDLLAGGAGELAQSSHVRELAAGGGGELEIRHSTDGETSVTCVRVRRPSTRAHAARRAEACVPRHAALFVRARPLHPRLRARCEQEPEAIGAPLHARPRPGSPSAGASRDIGRCRRRRRIGAAPSRVLAPRRRAHAVQCGVFTQSRGGDPAFCCAPAGRGYTGGRSADALRNPASG
jgi:hypothetical protein